MIDLCNHAKVFSLLAASAQNLIAQLKLLSPSRPTCKRRRRTGVHISLISHIHRSDETILHREHVKNLSVRKNLSLQALH